MQLRTANFTIDAHDNANATCVLNGPDSGLSDCDNNNGIGKFGSQLLVLVQEWERYCSYNASVGIDICTDVRSAACGR